VLTAKRHIRPAGSSVPQRPARNLWGFSPERMSSISRRWEYKTRRRLVFGNKIRQLGARICRVGHDEAGGQVRGGHTLTVIACARVRVVTEGFWNAGREAILGSKSCGVPG
jgi:hypothetical protein